MDWYAPIARHVMIPLQARREGARWPWYVDGVVAWEKLSAEEIRQRQWEKLARLLAHAYENVPYYRRVFDERGLRPHHIASFDDTRILPMLTKQDILRYGDDLVARNLPTDQLVDTETGGTTGIPMRFKYDRRCWDLHFAGMAAFARWYGFSTGRRQALIWGAAKDLVGFSGVRARVVGRLTRRPLVLNAYAISRYDMARFTRALRTYRPIMLRGYTSALEAFARVVGSQRDSISVPTTVCTAEPLGESQRLLLEGNLHTEVFNEYAGREFGLMATECRLHRGLHVNVFSLYLEILAGDVPARSGELGRFVGTDLDNYGMPFIRYDLGDMGRWAERSCPCGIESPLLASVEGRSGGMLVGTQGAVVSGAALTTVMAKLDIPGQLQFLQARDLSVEVRVVPDGTFAPRHEEAIRDALGSLLGDGLQIALRRVDEIPRTRSGKYTYAESHAEL